MQRNFVERRMCDDDVPIQRFADRAKDALEGRSTGNRGCINAVNGDVYPVKMVLRVDVTFPFVRENAIRETRNADLANGRHIRICSLNVDCSKVHYDAPLAKYPGDAAGPIYAALRRWLAT